MSNQVTTVTLSAFISLLCGMKNWRVLGITIQSKDDPAPRKGDKGRIVRVLSGQVQINRDTDKLREAAGLEVPGGPLPWGEWVGNGLPFITHKGGWYLAAVPVKEETAGICGVVLKSHYETADGTPLDVGGELVQSICFRKADGTPFAEGDKSKDYGFRVFSFAKMNYVKATIDGITYDCHPQLGG